MPCFRRCRFLDGLRGPNAARSLPQADVVAQPPGDAKGRALIPLWEADYRTYIEDRRAFSKSLREGGENVPFYETEAGGIPISEKLETFAADNHMASCAPPRDLTR